MALPTPAALPTERTCLTVQVPDSREWRVLFVGALWQLTRKSQWEQVGQSIDDVTDLARDCFFTHHIGGCMVAGIVVPFAGTVAPAGWLFCDGAEYDQITYPSLFSTIGQTYGGGTGTFCVPDLRYKMAVGAGQYAGMPDLAVGDTGGSPEHQLTVEELAAHDHPTQYLVGIAQLGVGDPVLLPDLFNTGNTGDTGGNQPHNNMPPFLALNWIIST